MADASKETIVQGIGFLPVLALSATVSACAQMPDATVGYYLPRSAVDVEFTRVLACGPAGRLAVVSAGSATARHMADPTAFRKVALSGLNGTFSASDATFAFYPDGRLKSVNSVITGRGEEVIRAALSVVGSMAGSGAESTLLPTASSLCPKLASWNSGSPVTLRYTGTLLPRGERVTLQGDDATLAFQAHAGEDGERLAAVDATGTLQTWPREIIGRGSTATTRAIAARPLAGLKVVITAPVPGQAAESWTGDVVVANDGPETDYLIPLPKPASFGKQLTAIEFGENGALIKLQYASEDGAAALLGATEAAIQRARGPDAAEKAQAISDEVELIAQQQRLAACRADPTMCR